MHDLVLTLKTSQLQLAWLSILILVSGISITVCAPFWWLKAGLLFYCYDYSRYSWRLYVNKTHSQALLSLMLIKQNEWQLTTTQKSLFMQLADVSFLLPYCVILGFKCDAQHRLTYQTIWRDSVPAEQFRRLLFYLRTHPVSDQPVEDGLDYQWLQK